MCARAQSMRDVVQCLLAQESEAVVEIQELLLAVHEVFTALVELDHVAQNLAADVERVRGSSVESVPIVLAVHDRVTAVSARTAQVVAAFRELDRGIKGWNVAGSDSPQSNGSPPN